MVTFDNKESNTVALAQENTVTLQPLPLINQEGGGSALDDAPRASAVAVLEADSAESTTPTSQQPFVPNEAGDNLNVADLNGSGGVRFELDQVGVDSASEILIFRVNEDGSTTAIGEFLLLKSGELADGFNPSFNLNNVSEGDTLQFAITEANGSSRTATATVGENGVAQLDFGNGTTLSLALADVADALNLVIANTGEDAEAIDFTGQADTFQVEFTVFREARFNSTVGLYIVDDLTGSITVGGNKVNVGDAGYAEAAQQRAIDLQLQTGNESISNFTIQTCNHLFGAFITVENTDTSTTETYFSFLGANGGDDHVKLLGNNAIGFEDQANLGDADYNDVVVTFKVV